MSRQRPRAGQRADWNDEGYIAMQGQVHQVMPAEGELHAVACLVIPDVEARHGWGNFWVYKPKEEAQGKFGFQLGKK